MLLSFLALVFCTFNQVAVEYGRVPITRVGIDGKRIKQSILSKMAANYQNSKFSFYKENAPKSLHNIHLFLEENFSLQNQSFVIPNKSLFKFSTLETDVDRNSLVSLYFNNVLDQYQIKSGSPLSVSSRDYFTEKQNQELCSIFGSLDYKVKSIPESLAACIQSFELGMNTPTIKNFYLNFKGSKVTGSLYEISKENESIKISLIETKEIDMKSDYDYENRVASLISDQLRIGKEVSFLPYEVCNTQYYSDIQSLVLEYLRDLKGELVDLSILEVNYYDRLSGQKCGSVTNREVPFAFLRNEISTEMTSKLEELVKSIPEDVNKFIITDIPFREKFANNFTLVFWDNVVKGLLLSHDSKFILNDSRICNSNVFEYSPVYLNLKNEISTKFEVIQEIIPQINMTIHEFKFLKESEKKDILDLIESNDSSLKSLRNIRNMWDSLQKVNTRREADSIVRSEDIRNLELAIVNANTLAEKINLNEEKDFASTLEETIKWLETAKQDLESSGFLLKANRLNGYVNFINKKIKQAEEKKIAEEQKALEEKQKASEIPVPESAEPDKIVDSNAYKEDEEEQVSEKNESNENDDEIQNQEDEDAQDQIPKDVEQDKESFKYENL